MDAEQIVASDLRENLHHEDLQMLHEVRCHDMFLSPAVLLFSM